MSFFDSNFFKDIILENTQTASRKYNLSKSAYPVGSAVVYSQKTKSFSIYSPEIELKDIDHYISVGIVLKDLGQFKYIVMFKNILNNEQEIIHSYNTNNIGNSVVAIFKDYCKKFKKKLTEDQLEIWENIEFILPGNIQMDTIYNNQSVIFPKLKELIGEEKTNSFIKKFNTRNFFCNLGGHVVLWHNKTKTNSNFYSQLSSFTTGYFLPIFILDLSNK